jgi:plastocyanin
MKTTIMAVIIAVGLGGFLLFAASQNKKEPAQNTTTQQPGNTTASTDNQNTQPNSTDALIGQHLSGAVVKSTVDATDKSEISVEINDFYFDPTILTVKKGTKITWTNQGMQGHDVTIANNSPNSFENSEILSNGGTHSVTLDEVGTYLYICSPHPTQMRAVIKVVE